MPATTVQARCFAFVPYPLGVSWAAMVFLADQSLYLRM